MLHMGYIAKKSSVLGIKDCIDIGDKIRASPVCHPNPYGNGQGDPPQTPLGQIRRRQGESCSLERWEAIVGGKQHAVLWRWHHPSSDQAQPAPTLGKRSCPDSTEKPFAGILYICLLLKTGGTLFKRVTEHFKSTETTRTSPVCCSVWKVLRLRQGPSALAGDRDPRGAGRQPSNTLHLWEL